jgi:transcription antitermination factor NusA-like protein
MSYMKADEVDESENVVQLLVPSSYVGVLIGSKGSEIKRMESVSRCKIRAENSDEPSTNTMEPMRRFIITGSVGGSHLAVIEACKAMSIKGGMLDYAIRLMIPNQAARFVIGKAGVTIKALQTSSGAKISVEKELCYGAVGRVVQINGRSLETSLRAQYEINRLIHKERFEAIDQGWGVGKGGMGMGKGGGMGMGKGGMGKGGGGGMGKGGAMGMAKGGMGGASPMHMQQQQQQQMLQQQQMQQRQQLWQQQQHGMQQWSGAAVPSARPAAQAMGMAQGKGQAMGMMAGGMGKGGMGMGMGKGAMGMGKGAWGGAGWGQ